MKLSDLEIRELAGLRAPLVLRELRAPLIAILGPNASGKSSVVRALRALLWPASTPERCYLSARFEVTGRGWIVERNGLASEWRRADGVPCAPPSLPPRELADCWLIGLETLAGASASEQGFAREVRKQLSGGFDLDALRARFETRAQAGRAEAAELKEAQAEWKAAQGAHERLAQERVQLEQLEERARAAERELNEAEAARLALPVLAVRAEIERLERELAELPPGLERLRGDERERHEQALRELEQRALERLRAALDLQRARNAPELRDLDAQQGAGAAAELEQRATRLVALRTRAVQLEQLERELQQARAEAGPPVAAGADSAAREPARLAELEQRLRAARSLEARIDLLRARIAPQDEAPSATGPAPVRGSQRHLTLALAFAGALCALALFFTAAAGPRLALAVCASAAFAAAGVLLYVRADEPRSAGGSAQAAQAAERALERLEVERTRELERAAELAAALGLARGDSTLELEALAHELRERAQLEAQRARAEQSARQLHARWDELRAAFAAELARADGGSTTSVARSEELLDAAACSAALGAAENRAQARERALKAVEQAESRAQHALAEEAHAQRALDAQLAAWGWTELEPAERLRRAELVPRRFELEGALRERRAAERGGLELVRGRSERAPDLLALPRAELEARARAANELAQRRDELNAQRARLGLQLEQARDGHVLEEALARVDAARSRLEQRRTEALEQRAASWLLERVSEQQERETAPAVLREARRLVRAFTRESIDLHVGAGGALEARELASGERRALEQLSSGTRAQLLLAARIAFAAEQERGEPLPLVFDEALATSDPARFEAVARALHALARSGRQLFFLTSDASELARLRQVVGDDLQVIDLAALRGAQTRAQTAELALDAGQRVPEPGTRAPQEYARALGVEALDPWAPPQAAHVFWIASGELQLLHALVQRGLERVGQLETWFEQGGALSGFDEATAETLRARAHAFVQCIERWRSGRARPLTHGELEDALPRASVHAAPLWEALRASGGDVQRLLDPEAPSAVRGFGSKRMTELRAQLAERGWLARGELQDEAAIARELARELEPQGALAALEPGELRAWTTRWCAACEQGEARRRRELYGAPRALGDALGDAVGERPLRESEEPA
jgi:exonuclease SbcC